MVHSVSGWTRGVQVKLWDPLITRAIPERLRGVFTTRRYTSPRLPYLTLHILLHSIIVGRVRGSKSTRSPSVTSAFCRHQTQSTQYETRGAATVEKLRGTKVWVPTPGRKERPPPARNTPMHETLVLIVGSQLTAAPPSSQQLWSAGFFCCQPCDMKLVTRQSEKSGHQQRLLQVFTEVVFLFSAYSCT